MNQTLLLSRSEVQSLVTMQDAIACSERTFRGLASGDASSQTANLVARKGLVSMKAGTSDEAGTFCLKSLGVVILTDSTRMRNPKAIIEQSWVTFLRTGAAGAVAARALARRDGTRVAILGAGTQARAQLLALSEVMTPTRVSVWSPTSQNAEAFVAEFRERFPAIRRAATAKNAVAESDVVVTVTRAKEPLFSAADLCAGAHINAMGADFPGAQEVPSSLLTSARVFADDVEQACWMGAFNVPIAAGQGNKTDYAGGLGEVLLGRSPGRTHDDQITVFDCSGLGAMDLALAEVIYSRAIERGVGTFTNLLK